MGSGGAVGILSNPHPQEQPFQRLGLPFAVDFHGVAFELVDGFLVGDKGTIAKLGVHGFTAPRICLL